jgi:hypothetical protein
LKSCDLAAEHFGVIEPARLVDDRDPQPDASSFELIAVIEPARLVDDRDLVNKATGQLLGV